MKFSDENFSEKSEPSLFKKIGFLFISNPLRSFVHHMGHAIPLKAFGLDVGVNVSCKYAEIQIDSDDWNGKLTPWQTTVMEAAGPVSSIGFSFMNLFAAKAIANHLPKSIAMTAQLVPAGLIGWEVSRAVASVLGMAKNGCDFSEISKLGKKYSACALSALAAQVALGTYLFLK